MFTLNEDLSIYATRGDIVFFSVGAEDKGKPHKFLPGDVVRIKVFEKKNAENVVLQKDFPVTEITESVSIFLEKDDMKIGDVISKHKDYWYEVVLNDDTLPQTIIGYNEDGAKLFRLFPEGDDIPPYVPEPEDIPVVDAELDMTSTHPVQNQAVARAYERLLDGYERTHAAVAEIHVTPQMFGAIGDGEADDTEAFKAMFADVASRASGSGWRSVPMVYIPHGTYIISEPLLNESIYDGCKLVIKGDSYTNTTIKVAAGCSVLFPNHDRYGFTQISDIEFIGADSTQTFMEVLSGVTGNAQSMYFHRCAWRQFHTVLVLGRVKTAATMTSETLISECKISNCGSAENPCELFVLDNSQSVNNRFYATDIESFVGKLFKYKQGNAITYYQGSIISFGDSVIVDGTEIDGNTSAAGNQPSLAMWGSRFEMHDNTKLLKHGNAFGRLMLSFNECGMGSYNLNEGVIPISISSMGSADIYFNRCRNADGMFCEFININSNSTRDIVRSRIHFNDCDMKPINFVENSTLTINGSNDYIAHPEIRIEGVHYNLGNTAKKQPLGKHLGVVEKCLLDGTTYQGLACGSPTSSKTYTNDVCSFVKKITLINLGNGTYSGFTGNKVNCAIYDETDTLLGNINGIPVPSGSGELALNKYAKTLKFVFSTDIEYGATLPVVALAEIIG
jgi:hypothetical protein